ncbi:MAG: septum formation initiator family protein [Ruminococcus sp.]|nr:septum formation initiator family protein [Ruminococcus sp.]
MIYSLVSIIGIQSQIRERKAELNELKEKITVQEIKNDEMQKLYDSTGSDFSALAEQIARDDLDYIKEGERVFVNVTGD